MESRSTVSSARRWVLDRRSLLTTALGACVTAPLAAWSMQFGTGGASLTKEQRDRLTPERVMEGLKKGNETLSGRKDGSRDYLAQQRSTAAGQYPAAVVLGCIDSRAPAEIIFDAGIGDTFNARIAGNVVNDDLLGSMEFGCAVAGAKVVLVFGHTACGAIKGAIDDVEMGNLPACSPELNPRSRQRNSTAKSRARTQPMLTLSRGQTSCSRSITSGGEAPSWQVWKKKAPSRSQAGCTTWPPASWSL